MATYRVRLNKDGNVIHPEKVYQGNIVPLGSVFVHAGGIEISIDPEVIEKWHRDIARERLGALVEDLAPRAVTLQCPECAFSTYIPYPGDKVSAVLEHEHAKSHQVRYSTVGDVHAALVSDSCDFAPSGSKHYLTGKLIDGEDLG